MPGEIDNPASLGDSASLSIQVTKSGPSIIQSSTLVVSFPAQSSITLPNYFLYPASIDISVGVS